ncbi:putative disease resistance protein At5g66900 [Bidens hawaiensis]|uniref:putative disease resistance protein At5g66900 n=1 Tax=Bidens hawaiensis TaxID=980011 RepID=UPI00404BA3A0
MVVQSAQLMALKTASIDLHQAVASETNKTPKFRTLLKRLDETLTNIQPILQESSRLSKVLDRPENETDTFILHLKDGKMVVSECSTIQFWYVHKKSAHANKLIHLDHELLRFFRDELQDDTSTGIRRTQTDVHALGRKMDRVLSTITKQPSGLSSSGSVPQLPDIIIGFDIHLKELKRVLLKDANQVVTVSAPGGCGKTTLAKMLCHDNEIKGIFGDNIVYVTVSRTTSLKTLVQKIFTHHFRENDCEFETDEEAKNQLKNVLSQMGSEKILLVLDDVWCESQSIIQDLKFPIPGYKILVTSRFLFPSLGSTYELGLLNDEDARTLLNHSAFTCDANQINVPDDLIIKMVKSCKGFPLALTVVGASLRGQDELTWRTTLNKWSEGQTIFHSNSQLLFSLQASVDALESLPIARECFLDLGSFPEDEKIAASALVDIWPELYSLDREGMYTIEYLLELSSRNLLNLNVSRNDASEIEGYCNEHYVTQHDLLRELAIHLSSQEPTPQRKRLFIEIHANIKPTWWIEYNQQPISARLLSVTTDETFSCNWNDLNAPKVEVLILNPRGKNYTLPHFIKTLNKLKALNITSYGIYPSELHELAFISFLSNLKSIRLEHVSLSPSIQSICELKNLQKLSFIICKIGNAFVDFSSMPPNLKELEFDGCYDLKQVPASICNLVYLRKLTITNCHELEALPKGLGSLSNLEILRVHSCTRLVKLPESIRDLCNLVFLDISDCLSINSLPDQIGELKGLRVLKMSGCHGLEELPASVTDLSLLEDVICDEETSYLWHYYESDLSDVKINVVEDDRLANFKKIVG